MLRQQVSGITRLKEDPDIRTMRLDLNSKVGAAHFRHDYVCKKDIDLTGILLGQGYGRRTIPGHKHLIAQGLEESSRRLTQSLIVFHQQNCFRTLLIRFRRAHKRRFWSLVDTREIDREGATFAKLAGNGDVTVILFHCAVYHRESEARTLPGSFRSEKRF